MKYKSVKTNGHIICQILKYTNSNMLFTDNYDDDDYEIALSTPTPSQKPEPVQAPQKQALPTVHS